MLTTSALKLFEGLPKDYSRLVRTLDENCVCFQCSYFDHQEVLIHR
ncbi:hypothetical protein NC651_024471 [Populus alba x Populus x berolinensis]|nr:hypothetical protein NC651_024471 [Populus alba x Populus x berolinensis]